MPIVNVYGIDCLLGYYNESGSIKDIPAKHMVERIEKDIVVASSGNFAIGCAIHGNRKNSKTVVFVSESISVPRLKLLRLLGCEIHFSSGLKESITDAIVYAAEKDFSYIDQFNDPQMIVSQLETARQVLQMDESYDYLVAAIGSGSTITALARVLKVLNPRLRVIGVIPKEMQVLEGSTREFHRNVWRSSIDEIVEVDVSEVDEFCCKICQEGYLFGKTGCAALLVSSILKRKDSSARFLTIIPDNVFKYLGVNDA